ncbi:chromate resistance protein ChrB domain-containing protein [Methylomonas methanica]|uniref:Chromate resistance exported protein n=1 Tax=Methylomonas methanica (strain DSM 25384 / MC09) TaxID=857087 RepID=G0A189_METMM|nr:chromate resistance protein ChrB domain-containing protein [Methylomonas methanica]AEG02509.1 Chromate resistance exported protein [Methylomonas methanica MC09]
MSSIGKILFIFWIVLLVNTVAAEDEKLVFSTWDTFEVDKCASIWLIKRYISPQAEIRFFKKGEPITEGIEFDTPSAKFRRYHNQSTFETLLEHYKLKEEKLIYLGQIIHDIEVNIWEKKIMAETPDLEKTVNAIISSPNKEYKEYIVEQCYQYFSKYESAKTPVPK